jgi:hypothetical protein
LLIIATHAAGVLVMQQQCAELPAAWQLFCCGSSHLDHLLTLKTRVRVVSALLLYQAALWRAAAAHSSGEGSGEEASPADTR